ncbi:DUF4906 domain-containing protein [Parabacteroides leei]|uniref:DUF4906 domain-containing protein n=1 Tax=Parabacteroides leei TaxID=2939491 RepID=UPI003242B430
MASIERKLETKGVIAMTLLTLVLMNTGCEDKIDNPKENSPEGKTVEVTFDLGFADEADGYTLSASPTTKSDVAGFNYALQLSKLTKGETTSIKPDKLYNLEIQQYDRSGDRIGGMSTAIAEQEIGSTLNLSLAANSDCQLVIVAWGNGNTTRLGTGNLPSAQTKSVAASTISSLQPNSQADMNKMPYVLHLEHVCVEGNTIKSIEGKDVRLLLHRLATRLTLNWTYSYTGYGLKQILLQSIPTDYKVVAAPDKTDNTYPSLLDQFTTIQLTAAEITAQTYSCWIPANVRGTNPAATSQTYRIKSNAPTGSSYVDFIAFNTTESKKKLSYRVYLGGSESSDFNMYGNTDYNYTVKINHTGLPINDRRVTIIDPIPASQNNDNLVPTANCFMVVPGGAFCFDPLKYQQNGTTIANSTLKGWSDSEGGIAYVKLLWQTKENGDVGDPVMGVVNSESDHTNIVDLKDGLIYCRVAPNTTGGNGLIAAYSSKNEILWSWHIWVTDYAPTSTGDETVLTPVNKRKLKFTNNGSNQPPMMDRNLGAIKGYTLSDPPQNTLDMSKANGFHYQWGRKDPFTGSYSAISIDKITGLTSVTIAPKGMLNRYGPDGINYLSLITKTSRQTLRNAYKIPTDDIMLGNSALGWCAEDVSVIKTLWNDEKGLKGLNDPCPVGWRVVSGTELKALSKSTSISGNVTPNASNVNRAVADGGLYLYFENAGSGEASYFRFTGYRRSADTFEFIGLRCIIWSREYSAMGVDQYYSNGLDMYYNNAGTLLYFGIFQSYSIQDGQVLRCIQESE